MTEQTEMKLLVENIVLTLLQSSLSCQPHEVRGLVEEAAEEITEKIYFRFCSTCTDAESLRKALVQMEQARSILALGHADISVEVVRRGMYVRRS